MEDNTVAGWLERARLTGPGAHTRAMTVVLNHDLCCNGKRTYPRVSADVARQAHYVACRIDGVSHNLAEMFALQQPPQSDSDREFLAGRGGCYDQFHGNDYIGGFYKYMAKKQGMDTTGKVYQAGLARFPGDRQAWISSRDDVKRICEERGWGCTGAVNVKHRNDTEPSQGGIARDIVDEMALDRLAAIPPGEKVDVGSVRHQIVQDHAPLWSKQEV